MEPIQAAPFPTTQISHHSDPTTEIPHRSDPLARITYHSDYPPLRSPIAQITYRSDPPSLRSPTAQITHRLAAVHRQLWQTESRKCTTVAAALMPRAQNALLASLENERDRMSHRTALWPQRCSCPSCSHSEGHGRLIDGLSWMRPTAAQTQHLTDPRKRRPREVNWCSAKSYRNWKHASDHMSGHENLNHMSFLFEYPVSLLRWCLGLLFPPNNCSCFRINLLFPQV